MIYLYYHALITLYIEQLGTLGIFRYQGPHHGSWSRRIFLKSETYLLKGLTEFSWLGVFVFKDQLGERPKISSSLRVLKFGSTPSGA